MGIHYTLGYSNMLTPMFAPQTADNSNGKVWLPNSPPSPPFNLGYRQNWNRG
jgi:hypothetical protein